MGKKKVWYKEKIRRKKKKKYKIKKEIGLLNGFKLLYSIGKQWQNSIQ